MKNLAQKIYLKLTTFFLLRKLKKLGYKFLFLFFLIIPFKVFAIATETNQALFTGSYNGTPFSQGPTDFFIGYTNSLSVTPYSNNSPQILASGTWEIRFYFLWNLQYNTPYDIKMYAGSVRAVCDGTESFDVIDSFYNSSSQTYTQIMMYNCSQLNVTQNFSSFRFDLSPLSGTSNVIRNLLIDKVGYGIYGNDPYDDILDNINNNTLYQNYIIQEFKGEVTSWFDTFDGSLVPDQTYFQQILSSYRNPLLYGWIDSDNNKNGCDISGLNLISGFGDFLSRLVTCEVIGSNTNSVLLSGVQDTLSTNYDLLFDGLDDIGLDLSDLLSGVNDTGLTLDDIKTILTAGLSDSTTVNRTMQNLALGLEDGLLAYADYSDLDLSDLEFGFTDRQSSSFIFSSLTSLYTINPKISNLVLVLMSLGVVALVLHRRGD